MVPSAPRLSGDVPVNIAKVKRDADGRHPLGDGAHTEAVAGSRGRYAASFRLTLQIGTTLHNAATVAADEFAFVGHESEDTANITLFRAMGGGRDGRGPRDARFYDRSNVSLKLHQQ